jgi:thiol-disulfide isomerase/thioredoxin
MCAKSSFSSERSCNAAPRPRLPAWGWIGALTAALLMSSHASAQTPIAPGTKGPAWSKLVGVDGKKHSLADLADAKVVVVVFTCNSCPFSVDYEDRLIAFAKEQAPKGVALVAINVNKEDEDSLEKMKERAAAKSFPFAYLHDPSQEIGKAYGAKVTPHVFVLDADRNVAYVGAFDNARKADKAAKHYVQDAVGALLAGDRPATAKTSAAGCSIKYE